LLKIPFLENKKLSGYQRWSDSIVMAHLFKLNYEIALAHCNFQLRGLESFGDQHFVADYAEANAILFF
jgi:tRNA(Ile)-lysidine synthase